MDKQRIVITGIGVVAPNGIGKEEFWANCFAGVSGIKPITLFDVSRYPCRYAGEISNFQPERYLGPKGLRNLDRTTLLALVAAKEAIEDAGLQIGSGVNASGVGIVIGSSHGSIHSISGFDRDGLIGGPQYVNPGTFPNTVMNSPAGQIAIRFGVKGLNATISTGFTAGYDALQYAMDMLKLGRVKTVIVGSVEELCLETYFGFWKLGLLANTPSGTVSIMERRKHRNQGMLVGEGAAMFVLEVKRGKESEVAESKYYGEIQGTGSELKAPVALSSFAGNSTIERLMRVALLTARLQPSQIGYVCCGMNALRASDVLEAMAIRRIFFRERPRVAVSCLKSLTGETYSASMSLQVVLALGALKYKRTPAVANRFYPRNGGFPHLALSYGMRSRHVLINGWSDNGHGASILVSGPEFKMKE